MEAIVRDFFDRVRRRVAWIYGAIAASAVWLISQFMGTWATDLSTAIVKSQWGKNVTGAVVLFALRHPVATFFGLIALSILVILILAYVETRRRGAVDQANPSLAVFETLAHQLEVLGAQLARFATERREGHPSTPDVAAIIAEVEQSFYRTPAQKEREKSQLTAKIRAYDTETLDIYDKRFAERLISTRRDALHVGLQADTVAPLTAYPRKPDDIAALGQQVTGVAARVREHASVTAASLPQVAKRIALLESQTIPRRLDAATGRALSDALALGLARYREAYNAASKGDPMPPEFRFGVTIVSLGRERETLDYRNDFEKSFTDGGFHVETQEWDAGPPDLDSFTGAVTLIRAADPKNQIRPLVAEALAKAGIPFREAPFPPLGRLQPASRPTYHLRVVPPNVAHIVVGQRGI
jgi:hypothetical protein